MKLKFSADGAFLYDHGVKVDLYETFNENGYKLPQRREAIAKYVNERLEEKKVSA